MERVPRIELGRSRWQRGRLPLHHTRSVQLLINNIGRMVINDHNTTSCICIEHGKYM